MPRAYIAVGSNLGNRLENLEAVKLELTRHPQVDFLRASSYLETEPVGGPPQGKYLNGVWEINTDFEPAELLELLLAVEKKFGRERGEKNSPRTIDLDILLYDSRMISKPGLEIPHPRMAERAFVLDPLCELAPAFRHPVIGKTMKELRDRLHERNK